MIDELCVRRGVCGRGVCGGVRQMGDVHGLESKHWDGLQLINAVPFISNVHHDRAAQGFHSVNQNGQPMVL